MTTKEVQIESLKEQRRQLKKTIRQLEHELEQENAVTVTWPQLQDIVKDFDNWTSYPHTLDDREEGYDLCGPDGSDCCSGICCVYPELYWFETLDKDFDGRIILCQVCWNNHCFKLEDFVDLEEYGDDDTFRLDRRHIEEKYLSNKKRH